MTYYSSAKESPEMPTTLRKPQVHFNREAWQKIQHYVNKCDVECSGIGSVEKRDGYYLVTDVMLLPQRNGGTHTDIEPEDMNRAMFKLRDQPGDLTFWWHSHVNMGVFWSGTDHSTIRSFGNGGMCLATVFNKKGEYKSAVFYKNPFGADQALAQDVFMDDLVTMIAHPKIADATLSAWDAEYKKNITDIEEKEKAKREADALSSAGKKDWGTAHDAWQRQYHAGGGFSSVNRGAAGAEEGGFDFTGGKHRTVGMTQPTGYGRTNRALKGWLSAFSDEIESYPTFMTRHEYVKHLNQHREILTMHKMPATGPFDYLGYRIECEENLEWIKSVILEAEYLDTKSKAIAEIKGLNRGAN